MEKLKIPLLTALMLLAINLRSDAQTKSDHTIGLYLTPDDYLNHKLSYEMKADDSKDKIYIHEFLGRNKVTVISNVKKIELFKSRLFGYHDSNGNDYRFYNGIAYQVIDTKGFYLYSFDKLVQQGKGPKPSRSLYFSTKANSALFLLTEENIDKAFATNYKFRNLVQAEFKMDNELGEYDSSVREYKIKELYSESNK